MRNGDVKGSGKIEILRPFLVGSVAISHAGNGSMLIVEEAELQQLVDAITRAIAAKAEQGA